MVSRYDIVHVEIYSSARKHNIDDDDIVHAVENAVVVADHSDGKALYLGTDRAGNLLEVVAVVREDGTEIVIPRDADAPHLPNAAPRDRRH